MESASFAISRDIGDGGFVSLRIEVLADGSIEIMRACAAHDRQFLPPIDAQDEERWKRILVWCIKREIRRAAAERFVPRVIKEGRAIFKKELKARGRNGNAS